MTDPLVDRVAVDRAADAFVAALIRWRRTRGLSKKLLAAQMGFDPSYVSHVEARRHRPTADFARRAEAVLDAGGAIWRGFREYDDVRQRAGAATVPRQRAEAVGYSSATARPVLATASVIVEQEEAELTYEAGGYQCRVRRKLYNAGSEPVTRYLARIAVDRYPGEPERSNRHYRDHPLTWAELNLSASRGEDVMNWRVKNDRDAFKEVWLLFENDEARFPLYPGRRTTIEYSYAVGEDKWGHWFQRAVRLPTGRLSVRLTFPEHLRPVVWGVETSLTAEAGPLRDPVFEQYEAGRAVFTWSTDEPPLNARFRFEWRFRAPDPPRAARDAPPAAASAGGASVSGASVSGASSARTGAPVRPSDLMRDAGIVQRGAPMLDRAARRLGLPAQRALAAEVVERIRDALQRVCDRYEFGKGVGLAAPQLGIDWSAAVVLPEPHGGGEAVVLLNPKLVGESVEHDEQYEGCLSFFDVRGKVSRPLIIEVEHESMDGVRSVSTFTHGLARLVAHEIDHLGGLLYTDRMPPTEPVVPLSDYPGGGQPWRY